MVKTDFHFIFFDRKPKKLIPTKMPTRIPVDIWKKNMVIDGGMGTELNRCGAKVYCTSIREKKNYFRT